MRVMRSRQGIRCTIRAGGKQKLNRVYYGFLVEIQLPQAARYITKLSYDSSGYVSYHDHTRYCLAPLAELDALQNSPDEAMRNAALLELAFREVRQFAETNVVYDFGELDDIVR